MEASHRKTASRPLLLPVEGTAQGQGAVQHPVIEAPEVHACHQTLWLMLSAPFASATRQAVQP